ncbi:MAG: tRNA epoxyqueuosine(34) reductase QueG [Planctomycetes bacterium]|nr:tRNA epoxyqueuosine(34) reductase QueG [Planctomycetota bacterium]
MSFFSTDIDNNSLTLIHPYSKSILSAISGKFDLVGVIDPKDLQMAGRIERWVKSGLHESMGYMETTSSLREDILQFVPWAESIIVVIKNYNLKECNNDASISKYAVWRDYHKAFKKEFGELNNQLNKLGIKSKLLVDVQPVPDRELAKLAGLGWIGKNTMLINKTMGSYFFIASIAVNVKLDPSLEQSKTFCGTCTRCIDLCPTNALIAPYTLDSKRCISYLTIEFKGIIPRHLRSAMGGMVFGCDICQEVCPWNKFAKEASETKFFFKKINYKLNLEELAIIQSDQFLQLFSGTPIMRAGWECFIRNIVVALGNVGTKSSIEVLKTCCRSENEIIRVHSVWAIGQLVKRYPESDVEVEEFLRYLLLNNDSVIVREEIENILLSQ